MSQCSPYPLFQLKTLIKRMSSFGFPSNLDSRAAKIRKWLDFIAGGDRPNPATDAEFLHEIFVDVLGYRSPFYTTEWLIVTNYQEIRLYHRFSSPLFYQQFHLHALTSSNGLKQFYFILCRRTLLTANPKTQEPSRTLQMLEESRQIEADIAKDFYSQYHKIRLQLIKDFQYRLQQLPRSQESDVDEVKNLAIDRAQKLLSRILFIAVGEDRQLLANGLLNNAYEFYNPYTNQPVWVNYKAIFNWMDRGNSKPNWLVNAYGGSLFAPDDILDRFLFVGDELCRQIKELTRFSFDEEISNAIIAFVLEESVKDLALLKTEAEKLPKRRKHHYPPKSLLNSSSVWHEIRAYLANKAPLNPSDRSSSDAEIVEYLQKRLSCLIDLKIVNANCNTGIALVTALDCLLDEYKNLEQELLKSGIDPGLLLNEEFPGFAEQDSIATICQRNLFGCDPDLENIEIAKLCLWLRTAQSDRPLIPLDLNIKQGDLSSRNLATRFTEIFAQSANPDCLLLIYTKM
jgi:hypothetical protein